MQQQMQQQQVANAFAWEAARKKNNEEVARKFGKTQGLARAELVGEWALLAFEDGEPVSKSLVRFEKNGKMTVTGKKDRTCEFNEGSSVLTEIVPGEWWGKTKVAYKSAL
jgi:hypothetical protein